MRAEGRACPHLFYVMNKTNYKINSFVFCERCKTKDLRLRLFNLARELKTIYGFDAEPAIAKNDVIEWYNLSVRYLPDKSFDLVWAAFRTNWRNIKHAHDVFYKLSCLSYESEYPPICKEYYDVARELIRLCSILDSYWSPQPFYLSCRMASNVLNGCEHSLAAMLLNSLVLDGILELVEKGRLGRASRYRFLEEKGRMDLSSIKNCGQVSKEVS